MRIRSANGQARQVHRVSPTQKRDTKDESVRLKRRDQAQGHLRIHGPGEKNDANLSVGERHAEHADKGHDGTAGARAAPEAARGHLGLDLGG